MQNAYACFQVNEQVHDICYHYVNFQDNPLIKYFNINVVTISLYLINDDLFIPSFLYVILNISIYESLNHSNHYNDKLQYAIKENSNLNI